MRLRLLVPRGGRGGSRLRALSAPAPPPHIGLLREGPLHAALKQVLAQPGDCFEVPFGRYVIDLVRADGELVEIQTGGFGPLGRKLDALLDAHPMRIVFPVAARRRIVRVDEHGEVLSSRRSPRRATVCELFDRLVSFPSLLAHPHLTIEVLLLDEDHVRGPEPVRQRRRTRDPGQRRLTEVLERVELREPADVLRALPPLPDGPFTTRELAAALGVPRVLAQRAAYCLHGMELLEPAGKRARAPLHVLAEASPQASGPGGGSPSAVAPQARQSASAG